MSGEKENDNKQEEVRNYEILKNGVTLINKRYPIVRKYKYLGIDDNLNFKDHLKHIEKKVILENHSEKE